jgi:hypothetical protein|tara:strand:- start:1730 stop:3262 length:1533 start_codon:yes stop_codon:yes gene_type:complete
MAKVYTGTYGSGTTAENALNTALMQYPEIARTLIQQYPRYAATYLLERTGRFAQEKVLGDNSFEWKVMGRYNAPSYSTGYVKGVSADTAWTNSPTASSGAWTAADAVNDTFEILIDGTASSRTPDFLNKWDMVRFQSGATAIVIEDPRANDSGQGASGDRIVKFETVDGANNAVQTSDVSDEAIIASIGSAFPNGSDGADVGENWVYPSTHTNWLTTMRKKCTVTGKDLTDVTWIENNGSRLWYFTREQQMMDEFMYQQELQRWYGRKSVTDTTVQRPGAYSSSILGTSGTMGSSVISGDGLLAQIDSSNQASYSMGSLTEDIITEFIAKLSLNATAAEGNEWVVFTGTEGRLAFHRAMKDLIVAPAGAMTGGSMAGVNGDVHLGANFASYSALGNKITVAHCPVFDDPNLHSTAGGTNSFGDNRLKESAKMVFMDFGKTSGVSNVELVTKGAEGVNRSMIKKYVAGMVNPYDQKAMLAANADDKFECHVLSETGIVVRNPLSCGILSVS